MLTGKQAAPFAAMEANPPTIHRPVKRHAQRAACGAELHKPEWNEGEEASRVDGAMPSAT